MEHFKPQRKVFYLLLLCIFAVAGGNLAIAADDNLRIRFTTTDPHGHYGNKHIHVVWLADTSGANDSLICTVGTNVGNNLRAVWAGERKDKFLTWWDEDTRNDRNADIDARTGATQVSYRAYDINWNFRKLDGTEIADGTYRLYFELTSDNDGTPRNYTYFTITKGSSAWSTGPDTQGGYSNVRLDYTPGVIEAPVVQNLPATNITFYSARLNGQVTNTGGENPTVYIYWGDDDGGTGSWDHEINLGPKGEGSFSDDIAGLNVNTEYFFRCYAVNSADGSWAGSTASFTTAVANPADINLDPEQLTFPDTAVGGYADLTFDIINSGETALHIISLETIGLDKEVYSFVSPPAVPFDIPPLNGTQITTRFAPVGAQTYNYASVAIGSNDTDTSLSLLALNGQSSTLPSASLQIAGSVGGDCHAVAISDQYVLIGQGATLSILDISNPSAPQHVGQARLVDVINSISLNGDVAYAAIGSSGIQRVDISNLSAPIALDAYDTPGFAYEVAAADNSQFYVADGAGGLRVYEILIPPTPVLRGVLATQTSAQAVTVSGTKAYVLDEQLGLQIIDLISPIGTGLQTIDLISPIETGLRGHWKLDGNTDDSTGNHHGTAVGNPGWPSGRVDRAISLDGVDDYVQITGFKGLLGGQSRTVCMWVSMNTPGQIIVAWGPLGASGRRWVFGTNAAGQLWLGIGGGGSITGTADICDGDWHHVAVVAEDDGSPNINEVKLYVDGLPDVLSLNASNVAINTLAGPDVTIGQYNGGSFLEGMIDDVRIYDRALSEYEVPLLLGPQDIIASGTCSEIELGQAIAVSGSTAYITDRLGNFFCVDVTDPTLPSLLSEIRLEGGEGRSVTVSGTKAYVAAGRGVLEIIDVSDPYAPLSEGIATTAGQAGLTYDVSISGSMAYVANGSAGLRVIDVSDPTAPSEYQAYVLQSSPLAVAEDSSLVYLQGPSTGVQTLDISSPDSPSQFSYLYSFLPGDIISDGVVDLFDFTGLAENWLNSGTLLQGDIYKDDTVDHLDLSMLMDNWLMKGSPDNIRSITISGQLAYIANGSDGLQIINISDPAAPSLLGSFQTEGYAGSIAVSDTLALLADGINVYVLDVSDSRSPLLIDTWASQGHPFDVEINSHYGYVANGGRGLLVLDLSNPFNITEAGSYQTPGIAYGVAVDSEVAYVADGPAGLQILDVSSPSNPLPLSAFDTPGIALNVVIADKVLNSYSKAYVADGVSGLSVIDISTPSEPTLHAVSSVPVRSWSAIAAGSQTIVADDTGGLLILVSE